MNDCTECMRGVKPMCEINGTYKLLPLVCPGCGADSIDQQDYIPECPRGFCYTEFECGSRYIVLYRYVGSHITQEICIVSKVSESSKCILDSMPSSGELITGDDII